MIPTQQADFNNSWRVNGAATRQMLDFDMPTQCQCPPRRQKRWETEADFNNYSGFVVSVDANDGSDPADPNNAGFMASDIVSWNGTLTKSATRATSIAGGASMDAADGWLSDGGNNPFYGAIYGANGEDITGVFATTAVNARRRSVVTSPLNNPTRGYINHSGGFNGDCNNTVASVQRSLP